MRPWRRRAIPGPSMTGEYTIIGLERREAAVRQLQRRLPLRGTRLEVA
jgi:hypothetical protein